jgi:hypothetical protein
MWRKMIGKHDGEFIRILSGTAKSNYTCDVCGKSLSFETECFAVSVWTETMRLKYYAWESEYLDLKNGTIEGDRLSCRKFT